MRRDPMTEPLDQHFESLRTLPPPDGERQAAQRAALLAQARQRRAPASAQRTRADRTARSPWWRRGWATAGALVALLLLLAGTSGAIYAADGAAPGDPLYAVDRVVESVRLRLTREPQAAARLLLALSTERLQEAQALSARGDGRHLQAALDSYGASISSLAQSLGDLDGADPAALTALIDEALKVHEVHLGHLLLRDGGAALPAQAGDAGSGAAPTGMQNQTPADNLPPDWDLPAQPGELAAGDEPADCVGADPHPVAQTLADSYGVAYEEIMAWFCAGYGMGEILHALQTSEVSETSPEELLALKTEIGGWGQVWQELGLIGRASKPEDRADLPGPNLVPGKPGGSEKARPEPAGPKPKEDRPANPDQSKKNKP